MSLLLDIQDAQERFVEMLVGYGMRRFAFRTAEFTRTFGPAVFEKSPEDLRAEFFAFEARFPFDMGAFQKFDFDQDARDRTTAMAARMFPSFPFQFEY